MFFGSFFFSFVATSAWCFNPYSLQLLHYDRVFSSNVLSDSVLVNQGILAYCTWLTAFNSVRMVHSALTEDAHGHFLSELELSDDSVSSSVFASSSRTCPLVELSHNYRVSFLERFDVSDSRVGHVALNSSAVKVFTCSTSTANSLIIRAFTVSEEKVVHRSLAACHELERL